MRTGAKLLISADLLERVRVTDIMLLLVALDSRALLAAPLATSRRVLPAEPRAQLSCAETSIVDATSAGTAEFLGAVVTLQVMGQADAPQPSSTSSVWVEALPPAGFIWADESVYSTRVAESTVVSEPAAKTMARVLAENSPLDIVSKPATASKPAVSNKPAQVQSWYDTGVRLSSPVTSWYDSGVRLETPSPSRADPLRSGINIDDLMIEKVIGKGTQSEVLLGVLPGIGQVAVKVGIKKNAIAREAPVLSAMSGFPCFPTVHHHEPHGELAAGGFLIVDVLGLSLEDLWQSASRSKCVDGQTFLRLGRGILRPLRQLHLEGFVHNDLKPANLLLGPGSNAQPTRLHLIDFGSCTQTEGHVRANGEVLPPSRGAIGTLSFASLAADGPRERPMCPADDIEGLVFTLAYLARGSLPWQGKPDLAATWKPGLLETIDAATELTADIQCATTAAALEALLAELRRCHADGSNLLSYDACLAALGGETWSEAEAEADALSELSLMAALGSGSSEVEAEKTEAEEVVV